MSDRPNFLFFITDQQRADWLGCYGHPVLQTPHIDKIAARGTRFDNFHVASPVCMPNRASLLTGRYPTQHGLRYNGCLLSQRANTFVDVLAASGYQTASIGKSHLQPFTSIEPLKRKVAATGPITEAWQKEEGDFQQEQPERYNEQGHYEFKTPYYGYQHVDMITAHGDRCGGHYRQWLQDREPNWQALHDDSNEIPHNYTCPQAYRTPVPEALYPTAFVKDRAIDFLNHRVSEDKPFFMFVSFPDPHHPFNPPGKYWDMYSPDSFSVDLPYTSHKNPTPPMQWLYDAWKKGTQPVNPQTAQIHDDEKLRQAMALTAGMVSMVDDAVGDVMSALHAKGLQDNTVVCFNSDHGDYLGDFNMLLKGSIQNRAITRVPFIWSDPHIKDQRTSSSALASTLDISTTVLERAGVLPYRGIMGKQLNECMVQETSVRDQLLIEFNEGGPKLGFDAAVRVRTLLTEQYRLSHYMDEDWGELYDHKADYHETENLWDDPRQQTTRLFLSQQLNNELTRLMDESPLSTRLA